MSTAQHRWKPLLICPGEEMSRHNRSVLTEMRLEFSFIAEYPRAGTIGGLLSKPGCNVCFVDVATDQERSLSLIAEAAADVPVVALNTSNDANLILRCLRRGAREFLAEATLEQIGGVLDRLLPPHASASPKKPARAYCVMPGKPGCGASTLAASLAIEFKRAGASSVLLVDADSVEGSLAFLLKLKTGFHLGDAVRDWKRMDQDLWNRLVAPCHGVAVLASPENPATPVEIDRATALGLLAFWREHYEAVVVDTPGVRSGGSEFATACEELLLVTTNELSALHATRRSIEFLEQNAIERARIKLIVNRYTPATGLKREDVEVALKIAPYALLENDYKVVQMAVLEGKPVAPSSHFARSVGELAARLTGKEKASGKRSSLFALGLRKN